VIVDLTADSDGGFEKVVIFVGNEIIKGFVQTRAGDSLDALLQNASADPPTLLRVWRLGDGEILEIPIGKTKAIFYVKEFDENRQQKSLRFYKGTPIMHGVWIHLEFTDGEIMEGLVYNTIRFLVDPGFFIIPSDPYSNNRLVYVVKSWLKDCRILGLRNI
jgi:hypothetical protein